jgi:hypothetical protein
MIFPYKDSMANNLKANVPCNFPGRPAPEDGWTLHDPYGVEKIWIVASTVQFTNIESEYAPPGRISAGDGVDNIKRGMDQIRNSNSAGQVAETFINYTILPPTYFDEINTYPIPDNLTETIQSMRAEVLRLGGSLSGDTQSGTFSYTGVTGAYRVSGDNFILSIRYTTGNQLTAVTRGAGSDYRFTIDKPKDVTQAVQAVRKGIEGKGGTFSGNETEGSFSASGIIGQYSIDNMVNIIISKRPIFPTDKIIESEIRKYFSGY